MPKYFTYLITILLSLGILFFSYSSFFSFKEIDDRVWMNSYNGKILFGRFFSTEVYCCVDTDSFENIGGGYARDNKNVYLFRLLSNEIGNLRFEARTLSELNPQEFQKIHNDVFKDKRGVYWISFNLSNARSGPFYDVNIIAGANPDTFQLLDADGKIGKDDKNIYIKRMNYEINKDDYKVVNSYPSGWKERMPVTNPKPKLGQEWMKDYMNYSPIDIASFELIEKNKAKDKDREYTLDNDGVITPMN